MALLTFDGSSSSRLSTEEAKSFYEKMCPAIAVLIREDVLEDESYTPMGHGFIVGEEGMILTAFHVVEGLWEWSKRIPRAREMIVVKIMKAGRVQQYRARILDVQEEWDMARLQIFEALDGGSSSSSQQLMNFDYVDLGNTDTDVVGAKWVYSITATNFMTFGMKIGRISNPRMGNLELYPRGTFTEVSDMHGIEGDSGGALFNSRGYVVGLLSNSAPEIGRDYAVHLDNIKIYLGRI